MIHGREAEVATAASAAVEGAVLAKAVVRAGQHLELSQAMLARIIGASEATVSRMRDGRYALVRGSKPFEIGLMFVRLFRGLDAMTGGDDAASRSWLRTHNTALGARPHDLIATVEGLTWTTTYVDSRRGII